MTPAVAGDPRGVTVFFTPESGVVPHYTAQAVLARTLHESGHPVAMVKCGSVFSHCPVMDMYNLDPADSLRNKEKTCGECQRAHEIFGQAYGLPSLPLREFLAPDLVSRVMEAVEGAGADLQSLEFDGIPFGELCVLDLVLATKICDFSELSEDSRMRWKAYIANAITSYLLIDAVCSRMKVAAVVTHEDYGLLLAARLAGRKHGVPGMVVTIAPHLGGDRRRYQVLHLPSWGEAFDVTRSWPEYRGLSVAPYRVREAADDVLVRFGAQSHYVYSPEKTFESGDPREKLGIPKGRRLLVLYTSSLDERLACTAMLKALGLRDLGFQQPFQDQIEWIRSVIDWVEARTGFYLVVRVHPREGANKREGKVSQHLGRLKAAFGGKYRNAHMVWPEDKVSSYDLAEIADLVLTSWSTLGVEMPRLGVPVLASTFGLSPRPWDDFLEWGPTREAYFGKLEALLDRPPSFRAFLHAYRWYNLLYLGQTLDFLDVFPKRDFHGIPPWTLPASADRLVRTLVGREDTLSLYKADLAGAQSPEASRGEEEEARTQVRRILHYLLTGSEVDKDYRLIRAAGPDAVESLPYRDKEAIEAGAAAVVWEQDGFVSFIKGDKAVRRYSPMARRLAFLSDVPLGEETPLAQPLEAPAPSAAALWNRGPALDSGPGATSGRSGGAAPDGQGRDPDLEAALAHKDARRYGEARRLAEAAIARGGASADWLNLLGHLEHLEGRVARAKEILLDLVERWPFHAKAHNNLAIIFWNEGDRDRALSHLGSSLRGGGGSSRAILANAVHMYRAQGRDGDARALCEDHVREHPGDRSYVEGLLEARG